VRIQTWIPRATLESLPDGKADVDKYLNQASTWNPETANQQYAQVVAKFEQDLKAFEQLPPDQQSPEKRPLKAHEPVEPSKNPQHPYGLYNGRVAPLMPFGIRGVLWYQGEANGFGNGGYLYRQQLPAMINAWRPRGDRGIFRS